MTSKYPKPEKQEDIQKIRFREQISERLSVIIPLGIVLFALISVFLLQFSDAVMSRLGPTVTNILSQVSIIVIVAMLFEISRSFTIKKRNQIIARDTADFLSGVISKKFQDFGELMKTEFDQSIELRTEHGFQSLIPQIDDGAVISEDDVEEVFWINTRLSDIPKARDSIRRALNRGISVNLLLMHPKSDCAPMRGLDTVPENYDNEITQRMIREYVDGVEKCYTAMLNFYDEILLHRPAGGNAKMGEFRLRFYDCLPGIPMLILRYKGTHFAAHTGYYLDHYSSDLPYIKWGTAKRNFVDHARSLFVRKWARSEKYDAAKEPRDFATNKS